MWKRVSVSSDLVLTAGAFVQLCENKYLKGLCQETLEPSGRPGQGGPHDIMSGWGAWKSGHEGGQAAAGPMFSLLNPHAVKNMPPAQRSPASVILQLVPRLT